MISLSWRVRGRGALKNQEATQTWMASVARCGNRINYLRRDATALGLLLLSI